MKKVLLLGDSIRMGYDDYVKEELDGKCEVVYDAEDQRPLRCVHAVAGEPDVQASRPF